MSVVPFRDPTLEKIKRVLPRVHELCHDSDSMTYYLGNGKDGWVFRMFNPDDTSDRSLEQYAVKFWNESFRHRVHEIDVHRHASDSAPSRFSVPSVVHVDYDLGCFVMDRVPGETAFRTLVRRKLCMNASMHKDVMSAFAELNKCGVHHNDPHLGNFMFTDLVFVRAGSDVIEDAHIWIIDFGRSKLAAHADDRPTVLQFLREDRYVAATP